MTSMRQVRSVCPYCGVGCGIVMDVEDGRVVKVGGDKTHPANRGRLCTKGLTCAQPLTAPGRLSHAYLRDSRDQDPVPVAVDQAIRATAQRLRTIIDTHGPDAVALYVSGQMSLEAQYLANKLAKGFIRTRHIESNSRLCMAAASTGYKLSLGADAPPGSYDDFDHADLFFVIGANMADCHPILFLRMMDRVKAGAKLIVVDPRRTATADKAHLHLPIRPGTDLALLNGLLHLLHADGHTDQDFIARCTEGWDAMPAFLADYTPERVAAITGLSEEQLRQAAGWIGQTPRWMSCWTMGLNQSTHGTWHTNAICNLHLATGAICRPGSGPFSLTGQPNAMGGREMGYMGAGLPGQRSALSADDRAFTEALWGLPSGTLRPEAGSGTLGLFDAMAAGDIRACWVICTNPVATVAGRQRVIDGLRRAELVITQDAFLDTETNRYADILLPGALWAEGDGVMVNSERNLTLAGQAVAPPGDALPDWEVIARVARAMGYGHAFDYRSAAGVFDEIRRARNPVTGYDISGASHERLRETPLQWPCPPGDGATRHPIRYRQGGDRPVFPTASGKSCFLARPWEPESDAPDDAFPLVLNTGRLQHQWHTLTKTGKVSTLNRLNPGPFVELHPRDGERLGIRDRQTVVIRSRRASAELPARLSDRVQPGQCFAPFHWNDVFGDQLAINALTNDATDPLSLQPAFKHSAVQVAPAGADPAADDPDRLTAAADDDAAPPAASPAVTVLWASQTGNAEMLATQCARQLQARGHHTALHAMDTYPVADLPGAGQVLLVTSTFGDGDPPDNGTAFWSALQTAELPRLDEVRYAVLALGDPSYDQFCGFGRRLDAHLAALGARRLLPCTDCEPDQHRPVAARWLQQLLPVLAPVSADALLPATETAGLCDDDEPETAATTTASPGTHRHSPLFVRLAANHLLSAPASGKETRQFVFDLDGQALPYEAGDALGVWPVNHPARVAELLALTGLPQDAEVALDGLPAMPLAKALIHHLDITKITPGLLRFVHERSRHARLTELLRPDRQDALGPWLHGRQIADLLRAFPVRAGLADWLGELRRLQPRLYSIASSPKAAPDAVHLTVSVVRYRCDGRARGGLCSTFLADRADRAPVSVFLQRSAHFRPPRDPDTPMIMVGPGTGVAPFRAFLQERQATGAHGRNWLFFGEQHADTDFYYRDEFTAMQRDGCLHRLTTAFSRDQADKIYVQDRMREHGAELWAWLQDGAHFYVCGDASRMARDVDAALRSVVREHGGLDDTAAADYVARLAREKRYVRDVY